MAPPQPPPLVLYESPTLRASLDPDGRLRVVDRRDRTLMFLGHPARVLNAEAGPPARGECGVALSGSFGGLGSPSDNPTWRELGQYPEAEAEGLCAALRRSLRLPRSVVAVTEEDLAREPRRYHAHVVACEGTYQWKLEYSSFAGAWLQSPHRLPGQPAWGQCRVYVEGFFEAGPRGGYGAFGRWPAQLTASRIELRGAMPVAPPVDARGRAILRAAAVLLGSSHDDRVGRTFRLYAGSTRFTVGRRASNQLPVDDPALADFHLQVDAVDGGHAVHNLGAACELHLGGAASVLAPGAQRVVASGAQFVFGGGCAVAFVHGDGVLDELARVHRGLLAADDGLLAAAARRVAGWRDELLPGLRATGGVAAAVELRAPAASAVEGERALEARFLLRRMADHARASLGDGAWVERHAHDALRILRAGVDAAGAQAWAEQLARDLARGLPRFGLGAWQLELEPRLVDVDER